MMKVATIGFFDGVHKGHQFLLHQVMEEAKKVGGTAACITFDCPPKKVIAPLQLTQGGGLDIKQLTTLSEKIQLLHEVGIEDVKVLHFTPEMARMTAYDFMNKVLKQTMDVGVLVIGYDHRFGHNREEGFEDYVRYGEKLGIRVVQAQAYEEDFITISSSLIRETLLQGRIADSRKLLGYDYFIDGVVVNGFKVGRKLGYPTANIEVPTEKLIPCDGVYVVKAELEGRMFGGMLNIGWRPTFNGNRRTIEVNLFDFDGNIYSEHITLRFIDFLRPEQKFESPEALIRQLAIDEQKAKEVLNKVQS
jgi:riboflavin kinase/FMN adenylyltransferase